VGLGELVAALGEPGSVVSEQARALEIRSLAYDSRQVRSGSLFFCVSGFNVDGHDFAPQAVERGAAALVVERELGLGVPEVLVPSVRGTMAPLAARFYGEPARELRVVGVTGTNGKTTTAYLVRALLVIGGQDRAVARTTPEAVDLQADLRAMLAAGDAACAMEVSSHALELGRADAIPFAAAIFTNLTQDHLDFHPTMEEYFLAKRRLFLPAETDPRSPPPGASIVNLADPYGRRLAEEMPGALTYAVDAGADYRAADLRCGPDGCRFVLRTRAGEQAVHALGGELDVLIEALEDGVHVPGRFEPVDEGQDFAVLVDYAHTPDSLENVLRSARELVSGQGRLVCVFGAGGDRDRGKRPLMGEIAARLSDEVIVTSDNPRSEDPEAIIAEIFTGIDGAGSERRGLTASGVADRREAIRDAIADGHAGDVLVIAGKGHEQGQEFAGGLKVPFDDVTVAREALTARAHGVTAGAQ